MREKCLPDFVYLQGSVIVYIGNVYLKYPQSGLYFTHELEYIGLPIQIPILLLIHVSIIRPQLNK